MPVVISPTRAATPTGSVPRLESIDVVRGAVMVLMAIDHVRVYSGVPAGGPTYGIFFTRWVTHFCAPAFVFLAGTGAFLHGRHLAGTPALARFLLTRGLLLIVLELTLVRASWTFSVDYSQFLLAGVIWMLGWCMVLMAALVWMPVRAIAASGILIMLLQNVFTPIGNALPAGWQPIWEFIYPAGADVKIGANGPAVTVLYTIVPWIGVMAAGYAFGTILIEDGVHRRRVCLRIGLFATAAFLLFAGIGLLRGGAGPGTPAIIRLLNQTKYPASQLFLLMTLGPTIAMLGLADRAQGPFTRFLRTFGRVPMFYYLAHIPLIHATALLVWYVRDGAVHAARFATAPYVSIPSAERWSLPLLYLVFAIVVAALYPLCVWYGGVKARGNVRWLRYL
jgi:uncharacterized membrane protein